MERLEVFNNKECVAGDPEKELMDVYLLENEMPVASLTVNCTAVLTIICC